MGFNSKSKQATCRRRVRLRKRFRLYRQRTKVWEPRWDSEIRGWAYNFIAENKWKLEYIHDTRDLMQDAYLVFVRVREAYPLCVEAPHFMSLYKTSLRYALLDRAREYNRKTNLINENVEVGSPQTRDVISPISNEGPFYALLSTAPPEVKMLLNFIKEDVNLEELRKPQREKKGEARLTFDQRLSKLLGIDVFPFRQVIKNLLT